MDRPGPRIAEVERLDTAMLAQRRMWCAAKLGTRHTLALAAILALAGCASERQSLADCRFETGKAVAALPRCPPGALSHLTGGACVEAQENTLLLACMRARGFEPVKFSLLGPPDEGGWQRTDRASEAWRSLIARFQ